MARTPKIDPNEVDPADAFARVEPSTIIPDEIETPSEGAPTEEPARSERSKKKKGDRKPRQPSVVVESIADDDGMDPFDAAEEVVGMMDGIFAVTCSLRGYANIQMPDGSLMLTHVAPDEKAKERMKRALARLMKSAGASMSPGAGAALTAFSCYGGPILAMEFAKASAKKASA